MEGPFQSLEGRALEFVHLLASGRQRSDSLLPKQWSEVYERIKAGKSFADYIVGKTKLEWSKTAYIESLTPSAKQLMQVASSVARGLTSSRLPMCLIPGHKRGEFARAVGDLYSTLSDDFRDWLGREEHLAICWVMGFKPRGDDARPDRGLPAFCRMLVGRGMQVLSVVYGPAPAGTWPLLNTNPSSLAQRNGLWEAVFHTSDALLVDSATDGVTRHGFLREHWAGEQAASSAFSGVHVEPRPTRIGENDLDTVLHNVFARFGGDWIFEGMCNPPGGDWSGLSLQSADRSREMRWLSLPRVSGKHAKRPDHVFQLFELGGKPIILAVESKDRSERIEHNIGPRLKRYVSRLVLAPASVSRRRGTDAWEHASEHVGSADFVFASGAAVIGRTENAGEHVLAKAKTDLAVVVRFSTGGGSCEVWFMAGTELGRTISRHLAKIRCDGGGITVRIS
jgi:hypothetical protein